MLLRCLKDILCGSGNLQTESGKLLSRIILLLGGEDIKKKTSFVSCSLGLRVTACCAVKFFKELYYHFLKKHRLQSLKTGSLLGLRLAQKCACLELGKKKK